jgi:hypothetical protein
VAVLVPSLYRDGGLYAGVVGHGAYRVGDANDRWERCSDVDLTDLEMLLSVYGLGSG